MSDLFNERRVRTRKPHRCAYCADEIAAGTENVLYEWGIFDGCGFSRYTCDACEPYVDRFWRYCNYECEIDLVEAFGYFMEQVADEPYRPRIAYGRDGSVVHVNCGNCWHPFSNDLLRMPKYCPSCQCKVFVPVKACQNTDENAAAFADAPTLETAREPMQTPLLELGA